jgi:hypothetical protein
MASNSGLREASRRVSSAAISCSTGTSRWAYAPTAVAFTRASSSRNDGLPDRSPRSTTVLRKKPTSGSSSVRSRPLTGEPTQMSCWPE